MALDVMVFTPVLRLEPGTVRGLFEMEWDGPLTVVLQRDNPSGDGYRDHLHQYQRGRELFLRGEYDALLVIESDILPPQDTLKRLAGLLERGADVAYGVYALRTGPVNVTELYYGGRKPARNMGEPLDTRGLYEAACKQGIIDCSGAGLGCVLIRREVIEAVPFEAPRDPVFFDGPWTQAVYERGFRMMADMGVQCGHVNTDGTVLYAR